MPRPYPRAGGAAPAHSLELPRSIQHHHWSFSTHDELVARGGAFSSREADDIFDPSPEPTPERQHGLRSLRSLLFPDPERRRDTSGSRAAPTARPERALGATGDGRELTYACPPRGVGRTVEGPRLVLIDRRRMPPLDGAPHGALRLYERAGGGRRCRRTGRRYGT